MARKRKKHNAPKGSTREIGIFVSTSRYECGAIERVKTVGVRTLLLKDVTDNLSDEAKGAFQSLIYLLATIASVNFSIFEEGPKPSGLSTPQNKMGSILLAT